MCHRRLVARSNNYLTIGQIYLQDTRCSAGSSRFDDIKTAVAGTLDISPGLSFIYAHVFRVIQHIGQEAI
jgi:xylulose-5-phosphate/fructose-6-phosphate phosphoketolase